MRLYLVRHAEAVSGEPDDLRPLTAAGRETARALGVRLAARGCGPTPCFPARCSAPARRRPSSAAPSGASPRPTSAWRRGQRRTTCAQPSRAAATRSSSSAISRIAARSPRSSAAAPKPAFPPARSRRARAVGSPRAAVAVTDLQQVVRRRTRRCAAIDFEIEAGEVFGLLGPNGAGKTTTVEILEGYREPRRGRRHGARRGPAARRPRLARADRRRAPVVGDVPEPHRRREPRALRRLLRAAARRRRGGRARRPRPRSGTRASAPLGRPAAAARPRARRSSATPSSSSSTSRRPASTPQRAAPPGR